MRTQRNAVPNPTGYPLTRVHAATVRAGINPKVRKRQVLSNAQSGKELVRDSARIIPAPRSQRHRPLRARSRYHRSMSWTNDPPTEPGTYSLRFKAAPGIDQTPLKVELHVDTEPRRPVLARPLRHVAPDGGAVRAGVGGVVLRLRPPPRRPQRTVHGTHVSEQIRAVVGVVVPGRVNDLRHRVFEFSEPPVASLPPRARAG